MNMLPDGENRMIVASFVLTQYQRVTEDGQTAGQTRRSLLQPSACRRAVKIERLGLEGSTSRSRLGLEDMMSRSRDLSLVKMHALHQACGYIMKKTMDLTRKKQFV